MRLRDAFLRATAPKPRARIDLFHVAPIRASVIDAVAELCRRAASASAASRSGSSPPSLVERLEVVVRFLADPRAVQAGPGRPRPAADLRRHRDPLAGRRSARRRRRRARRRLRRLTGWQHRAAVVDTGDRGITDRGTTEWHHRPRSSPAMSTESRRALEAVVMVADEPVGPRAAGPAGRALAGGRRGDLRGARRHLRGRGARLPPGEGGRRLPLPEPRGLLRVRRALRARRPVRPALGRRARDAGDRRLQAADLAGPGRRDPRRQRRRRDAHAAAARLHRRGRP